jgi:hypothetical protein
MLESREMVINIEKCHLMAFKATNSVPNRYVRAGKLLREVRGPIKH